MKYLIPFLFVFTISCQSIQIPDPEISSEAIPAKTCADVSAHQKLNCIAGQLSRSEKILKDPGTITSQENLKKTSYCTWTIVKIEYGKEIEDPDFRMRRAHVIKVCRYDSVWERIVDNSLFFGGGVLVGGIIGFAKANAIVFLPFL